MYLSFVSYVVALYFAKFAMCLCASLFRRVIMYNGVLANVVRIVFRSLRMMNFFDVVMTLYKMIFCGLDVLRFAF